MRPSVEAVSLARNSADTTSGLRFFPPTAVAQLSDEELRAFVTQPLAELLDSFPHFRHFRHRGVLVVNFNESTESVLAQMHQKSVGCAVVARARGSRLDDPPACGTARRKCHRGCPDVLDRLRGCWFSFCCHRCCTVRPSRRLYSLFDVRVRLGQGANSRHTV